jgi:hypothetical protein
MAARIDRLSQNPKGACQARQGMSDSPMGLPSRPRPVIRPSMTELSYRPPFTSMAEGT